MGDLPPPPTPITPIKTVQFTPPPPPLKPHGEDPSSSSHLSLPEGTEDNPSFPLGEHNSSRFRSNTAKTGIYDISDKETFELEPADRRRWFGLLFWFLALVSLGLVAFGIARAAGPREDFALMVILITNFIIWYVLYLRFQLLSTNRQYLRHIRLHEGAPELVERLRSNKPIITMKIRCFHYTMESDHHLHFGRGGGRGGEPAGPGAGAAGAAGGAAGAGGGENEGNNKSREVMTDGDFRRVYTFEKIKEFPFDSWEDHSPPLLGMERYSMVKLKIKAMIGFADQYSKERFEIEQARFIEENKGKDALYQYSCFFEVPGLVPKVLSIVKMEQKPMFLSKWWFNAFTFGLFGWPYSYWMDSRSTKVNFLLKKVVRVDPEEEKRRLTLRSKKSQKSQKSQQAQKPPGSPASSKPEVERKGSSENLEKKEKQPERKKSEGQKQQEEVQLVERKGSKY